MRYALCAALALHGLIHVAGFVAAFRLTELPVPNVAPAWMAAGWIKLIGVLWLLAAAGFIASAAALAFSRESWWLTGSVALVLSQLLIVLAWSDAKFGTLVNVLLVLPLAVGAAHAAFERDTRLALNELLSQPAAAGDIVQASELSQLPPPVARWLTSAGVVGRARPRSVWLRQSGELRTSADARWMPCEAEQRFRIDRPGFVWSVRTRMWGVLPIDGRDSYLGGRGHMLIEPLSLLRAVDSRGPEIDQGTLLRFLGEIVWFPSAALEPYLQWQAIDDRSAKVAMSYAGTTATATFEFAEDGRVTRVAAERYMSAGSRTELRPWIIPIRAWKRLDGIVVPTEGDVTWQLDAGPFEYYRWTIEALGHDAATRAPASFPSAGSADMARSGRVGHHAGHA